jgi:hypothetical protein
MSLFRPLHWYHSRADLILPVGPFNGFVQLCTVHRSGVAQNKLDEKEKKGIGEEWIIGKGWRWRD